MGDQPYQGEKMRNCTFMRQYIKKSDYEFRPDDRKVITRYFYPDGSDRRAFDIWNKILALPEERVDELLEETLSLFRDRHRDIKQVFEKHYEKACKSVNYHGNVSAARRLLTGSYFTMAGIRYLE